jgi:hypothetical protein
MSAISSREASFKLSFQLSPIIMTGGIASFIPGGLLPIMTLASNLSNGIFSGTPTSSNLDNYFAYYQPLPGSTLISQQIATYPFANSQIAANATIQQPLTVSMLMICPVGGGATYTQKLAIITAMQLAFQQHNINGGLYTVMTPFFIYTNMILTDMTDTSSGATHQVQNTYKLDFIQPLVSSNAAASAQNSLMGQITNSLPGNGQLAGPTQSIGSNVTNLFSPSGIQPGTYNVIGPGSHL